QCQIIGIKKNVIGIGTSRRKAEQDAAQRILIKLGIE
ncbi:ribonuclease III, partial [Buchnera aphidicola (Hormaphis cornu)]